MSPATQRQEMATALDAWVARQHKDAPWLKDKR